MKISRNTTKLVEKKLSQQNPGNSMLSSFNDPNKP